jgi:hypothetical protein
VHPDVSAMLGRNVSCATSEVRSSPLLPTGMPALDRALEGGLPQGAMTEISGRGSAGRMTLALGVMAERSRLGARVAWVDGRDRLDISSVEAAGVVRKNFLWVRSHEPRKLKRSLCAAEILLDSRDFSVVTLDLVGGGRWRGGVKPAWWVRLGRKAAKTDTALLVLGDEGAVFGSALRLDCKLSEQGERGLLSVCFRWRRGVCGEVEEPLLVMPPMR